MFKFETHNEHLEFKRIGTLPFRSHYIPFLKNDKFEFKHNIIDKYSSSEVISLNGIWSFKDHKRIDEIKFIDEELVDSIDVPSCVQSRGYDYFQYTNFKYPFPVNPPKVPEDNPVFHYRKTIFLQNILNPFIVFEGVDNGFYLFVNNKYVGYSQVAHSKSEFDLKKYLVNGENVIDVFVVKWGASSYLEDQDKFRFSGIFRDVYLLNRPDNYIWDYKIETVLVKCEWYLKFTNLSKIDLLFTFEKKTYKLSSGEELSINVRDPKLWSDVTPNLYDVIIESESEKILERIGFRSVEIVDGIFKINGKHQKLKGVNRHESNPENGATVTIEDTVKDLELIKSINANAIRTSHYPDIPEFYELCDFYGIYLVNEADVECHGLVEDNYDLAKWQAHTNSGMFDESVFDREVSLYERDKNRTSVIIWSLGNESSYGKMFYKGADYIHKHDSRPIHYESIWNMVDKTDYYTDRIDIISRMYPSIDNIKQEYLADPKETRPLLICEYSHAMGNSCGDVKDYWEIINSSDRIIGAFIWEWCDHAVVVDGKLKYGSDFSERHNDGCFCVDGLVTPYREFKSSTLEVKAVYGNDFNEPELIFNKHEVKYDKNVNLKLVIDNDGNVTFIGKEKNILESPITLNLARANIDNEMHDFEIINKYKNAVKKVFKISDYQFEVSYFDNDNNLLLVVIEKFELINDVLKIDISYEKQNNDYLQRVGLRFSLNKNYQDVTYVGFGEGESYIDKHNYAKVGKYSYLIEKQKCPYLRPQEYGSHYYASELNIENLSIFSAKPFSFSCLPYSIEELTNTKHNYELRKQKGTFVCLDVAMAGVGTHSCGPELAEQYRVPKKGSNTFYLKLTNL